MRVLVVDDDPTVRQVVASLVRAQGHEAVACADGAEAWRRCQGERFPMVVTDWDLPGLDGAELARRIRAQVGSEYVYIVMISGEDQVEPRTAYVAGCDDLLAKPLAPGLLAARLRVAARIHRMQHELARTHAAMQRDVEAAARVQRGLLPAPLAADTPLDAAWRFAPWAGVGGDFLSLFRIDEAHVAFCLFDVVGHGIAAALLAMQVHRQLSPAMAVSTLLKRPRSGPPWYELVEPRAVILGLAAAFRSPPGRIDAFTLCYGLWHLPSRRVRLANAGQSGILLRRAGTARALDLPSRPIGLFAPEAMDPAGCELVLGPEDALVLASDGIAESAWPDGRELGEDGLLAAIAGTPGDADDAAAIADRVMAAAGPLGLGGSDPDDRTVLVLRPRP